MKTTRSIAAVLICTALLVLPVTSFGATLVKANTITLVNAGDWTNNVAPTASDTCSYFTGSTLSLSNSLNQTLGGNLSISNLITRQANGYPVVIKADGYTLTLNATNEANAISGLCAIDGDNNTLSMTTINCPISLAANATFRNTASGLITLKGAIGETGGAKSLVIMTPTSNGQPGSFILMGANTYSGGTYIGRRVGVTGENSVSSTLVILGTNATLGASGSALTMTATGAGINLDLGGTTQTLGTVNFGSWCNIQNGSIRGTNFIGDALISANLVGTGAYTLNSNRILVLSGTNTYSGGTTIASGTLRATKPAALPLSGTISLAGSAILAIRAGGAGEWGVSDLTSLLTYGSLTVSVNGVLAIDTTGGNFSYSSAIAGPSPANLALTKQGANTLTLTSANTYQKVTTINRGTLLVDNTAGGSLSSSSPLSFSGTGAFNYNTASTSQNLGALTFSAGEGTVQITRSSDAKLTFLSLAARTAGATANFSLSAGTPSSANGFVVTGKAAGFGDSGLFFGGSAFAWYDASGFFRAISYSGTPDTGAYTSAGGASLASANGTHQQITGAVTAQTSDALTTLNISGNNNITLGAGQTLTLNGLLKSGNTAGGATISGGTVQPTSNVELVVRTDSTNDTLTISSVVGTSVPSRTGTASTSSAIVTGLSDTADLAVGMTVAMDANTTTRTISSINSSSQITLSGNAPVGGTPTLKFFSGSLTKSGAGILTLSGANTLAGGVRLNAGQLNINSTNALGGAYGTGTSGLGTFTINEGSTIDNTSGSSITTLNYSHQWNGSFTFVGSSDLCIPGSASIANDITITTSTLGKTLKVGNINQTMARLTKLGTGTLEFDANSVRQIHGGLYVYEGVYAAASTGGNYWQLIGAGPTFLGDPAEGNSRNAVISCIKLSNQVAPIFVQAGSSGTLAIHTDYSVSMGSLLTLNNNLTLAAASGITFNQLGLVRGTGNLNIGVPSGGLASFTVFGTAYSLDNVGTVKLMNENTFTGNTVINSGALQIYNPLALQNSILDTSTSVTNKITLGGTVTTALTLGGLSGNKNIGVTTGDMFATSSSGYTSVTNLTLNPSVGQTPIYSGIIKDGAVGMTLIKTGAGTQTLSGTNTYTGSTIINAGTLALGTNNVLPSASSVIMAGGILNTATYTNTLSTLEVTGSATINLGSGGALVFADNHLKTWTGTLSITGIVGNTSLRFGENAGGLSVDQLSRITLNGRRAVLSSKGYVVPFSGMVIQFH